MFLLRGGLRVGHMGARRCVPSRTVIQQYQGCFYHSQQKASPKGLYTVHSPSLCQYRKRHDYNVRSFTGSAVTFMPKLPYESLVPGSGYPEQSAKIHLLGLDNENIGETTAGQAVQMAMKKHCKVVLVESNNKGLPLCKLMSGKTFAEEETKQRKEGKKMPKSHELQIGSKISDHDLRIKVTHTRQLLRKGSLIKVTLKNTNKDGTDKGMSAVFEKIIEACKEDSDVQKVNKATPAVWTFLLVPCAEQEPASTATEAKQERS